MRRLGTYSVLVLLFASYLATLAFAANGYGYSSITLNQSSVSVALGGSAAVGYTVNLVSGNTWGTNFVVDNQAALEQKGIDLSPSVNSGDPPFSGTLSIQLAQYATPGTYTAILSATGDDPTTTNTTLTIIVSSSTPTTSGSSSSPHISDNIYGTGTTSIWPFAIAAIIILIGGILAATTKKAPSSRLIILGVVLILLGMVVWLYGDYSYGNFTWIWTGVIVILIGVVVWLAGDHKGHLI